MIWGRTIVERALRKREAQARREPLREWHCAFVWLPVPLGDGRWAWCQSVGRRLVKRDVPASIVFALGITACIGAWPQVDAFEYRVRA